MGVDPKDDGRLKERAWSLEGELVEKLQRYALSGECLVELCLITRRLRSAHDSPNVSKKLIEVRLNTIATLAAELVKNLNELQPLQVMGLSLQMSQPSDYSKFHKKGSEIPVTMETMLTLQSVEVGLNELHHAAVHEVEQMIGRRGGRPAVKTEVQRSDASYIKHIAMSLDYQKKIVPNRGKDFTGICTAVFECASVKVSPVGAIKVYLASLDESSATSHGVQPNRRIHKIK